MTLHDGGPYHIETNPLVCFVNQWTGFYIIKKRLRCFAVNFVKGLDSDTGVFL